MLSPRHVGVLLACVLAIGVGSWWSVRSARAMFGAEMATAVVASNATSPTSPVTQAITGIALSGTAFPSGAASGTVIGAISETMSPASPVFAGSNSLSSANGGDTTHFQISGTNLETLGSGFCGSPPCTYTVSIKATPTNPLIAALTQSFTVTASANTLAPSIATAFDDDAAGVMVTALWAGAPVPGSTSSVQTLNSCSASGWSAVQCAVYQYSGDTASAPYLQLTRGLTSGDLGAHTVSVSGGGYSGNVTITVTTPQPTTPPSYIGQTAQGYIGSNAVNTLVYTGQFAGPCGNGAVNPGFPVVVAFDLVDFSNQTGCNMTDYHQAALGNYTSTWIASLEAWNSSITGGIVGVRVDSEWQGGGAGASACATNFRSSPYTNNPGCTYGSFSGNGSGLVSPSDFTQAIQRFADAVHADSNLKNVRIVFQGPCDNKSDINYWPASLSSHIDSGGSDWYFSPMFDGSSSTTEWTTTTTPQALGSGITSNDHSGCSLANQLVFAASRGLSWSTDELCDEYQDGYNLTRLFFWGPPQYWERSTQWNTNSVVGNGACLLDNGSPGNDINPGASAAYHDLLGTGSSGNLYHYNGPWTNYTQ